MLTAFSKAELQKQQYRIVGSHSAVKVCGWTKKMLRGEGACYKFKFYGIRSNQCMQMTTSLSCANRCVFCWRGYKAPVSKEWKWGVDDPLEILEGSLAAHDSLLIGFKGNENVKKDAYGQSRDVRHIAISLTGEPITYPRINEFITECHKRRISTFLVTNAQYPEQIKNLGTVTQLYLSMDAPNKQLLREIDKPLFPDFWERYLDSIRALAGKRCRTCVRLTMIKGMNICEPENYAGLIMLAKPDFIELKGYMFVGASRQRLSIKNMPLHGDVQHFAGELLPLLPEYEFVSDHKPSRAVLLAKKSWKKKTWIDFETFFWGIEKDYPRQEQTQPEQEKLLQGGL